VTRSKRVLVCAGLLLNVGSRSFELYERHLAAPVAHPGVGRDGVLLQASCQS